MAYRCLMGTSMVRVCLDYVRNLYNSWESPMPFVAHDTSLLELSCPFWNLLAFDTADFSERFSNLF